MVTATVGSDSVAGEAACYDDGKAPAAGRGAQVPQQEGRQDGLRQHGRQAPPRSRPEDGRLRLARPHRRQARLPDAIKKTYYSFPGEAFFQSQSAQGQPSAPKKSVQLSVVETSGGDFKGIWHFTLKNTTND